MPHEKRRIRIVLEGSATFIDKTAKGLGIALRFGYPNADTSVTRVEEKAWRARTVEGFAREIMSHAEDEAHAHAIQVCAYAAPYLVSMNHKKGGRKTQYPVIVVAAYTPAGTGDIVLAPYAPLKVPANGIRRLLASQARAQQALARDNICESEETKRLAGLVAVYLQGQPGDPIETH